MNNLYRVLLSIVVLVANGWSHEFPRSDEEVTRLSMIIVDGEVIHKKLLSSETMVNPVTKLKYVTEEYEYTFKVVKTFRGGEYLEGDVLSLNESICFGPGFSKSVSFSVGDRFRYFWGRGKLVDGKLVADQIVVEQMKSESYKFYVERRFEARPELFGTPLNCSHLGSAEGK